MVDDDRRCREVVKAMDQAQEGAATNATDGSGGPAGEARTPREAVNKLACFCASMPSEFSVSASLAWSFRVVLKDKASSSNASIMASWRGLGLG
jgi:hypothetical protein